MNERFKAFVGKARVFEDKELGYKEELVPFKGKDLDILLALSENPTAEQIVNLVYKGLEAAGEEITKEEVAELDVSYITWVATCLGEVNGTSK